MRYLIIPTLGDVILKDVEILSKGNMWAWLTGELIQYFDEPYEHVAVLYDGQRRDMFVGETSAINGRHIRNIRATEIYRANAIAHHNRSRKSLKAKLDPESLDFICGPAVLFPDEIVWR